MDSVAMATVVSQKEPNIARAGDARASSASIRDPKATEGGCGRGCGAVHGSIHAVAAGWES